MNTLIRLRVQRCILEDEWTTTMPQTISELLQKNFTFTRNSTSTRVFHLQKEYNGYVWKNWAKP